MQSTGVYNFMLEIGLDQQEATLMAEKMIAKTGTDTVPVVSVFLAAFIIMGDRQKELKAEIENLKKQVRSV